MIATVIPVKPARQAKSRLRSVLSPSQRADLVTDLLVATLQAARSLGPVAVVSRSERLRHVATEHGATSLVERGEDLNTAVLQGLAWAARQADTALVLPGDLPAITPRALAQLATLLSDPPGAGVVVVPCQREEGTNALLLRPPHAIAPAFGPSSFARHLAAARAQGLAPVVHRSPAFVDIDLPEDLRRHGAAACTVACES